MKRKIVLVGAAVLALLLIACCFYYCLHSIRIRPPKDLDYRHAVITLERTSCYGTCPVYRLTIYGDGRVVYEGQQFVPVTGRQTAQISPDEVRALVDEFYRIDYFSLKDRYMAHHGYEISDAQSAITSITIDGRSKEVWDRYDCGPKKLEELEKRIDEVADTKRWVEGGTWPPES